MTKKFLAVLLLVIASGVYGVDFAVLGYLPSLRGYVAGTNAIWNRFEGREDVEALTLPCEIRFVVASVRSVVLHAIGGYTFYVENDLDGVASCNVSLGLGFCDELDYRGMPVRLTGLSFNLYPLYEFPVATFGKEPIARWKFAMDAGLAFNLFSTGDSRACLYVNLYARMIGAFVATRDISKLIPVPWDFGAALGLRFF
jgi:hypothetical protein